MIVEKKTYTQRILSKSKNNTVYSYRAENYEIMFTYVTRPRVLNVDPGPQCILEECAIFTIGGGGGGR